MLPKATPKGKKMNNVALSSALGIQADNEVL